MNDITAGKQEKDYRSFDYKTLTVPQERISFALDCYESLGWELDSRIDPSGGTLALRRSRKIANKTELTRLERNLDSCVDEIRQLEASKKNRARMAAWCTGLFATALLALSVFAITAEPPLVLLSIAAGFPGIAGWVLAPILYRQMVAKRSVEVRRLLNGKYDEIDEICAKARALRE